MSMDMFEQQAEQQQMQQAALATRMRPNNLNNLVGQEHILDKGRVLRRAIESDRIPSVILWGRRGVVKPLLYRVHDSPTSPCF